MFQSFSSNCKEKKESGYVSDITYKVSRTHVNGRSIPFTIDVKKIFS
jgi:hypothetical protein